MFEITKGQIIKAQKIVIYGPEGIGKTTFAADFPSPIFIDTEDGSNMYNVARFPRPTSWEMLRQEVEQVIAAPNSCKTLVIDSVDWAEGLCTKYVCDSHQVTSIEDFAYGKGYVYLLEAFGKLLNRLSDLTDKGVNVVLTGHCMIRKFERPDDASSYDRYELKLGTKAGGNKLSAIVKEWADALLFANYKTIVIVDSKTKKSKASGGERVMYTTHTPCWDAKNRMDLPEEMPFKYEQIRAFIERKELNPAPAPAPTPKPVEVEKEPVESEPKEQPKEQPKEPATKTETGQGDVIPPELKNLMDANEVTPQEIYDVVAARGYYPKETLIKNYEPAFVSGCLIGAWEQVFKMIKEKRALSEAPF